LLELLTFQVRIIRPLHTELMADAPQVGGRRLKWIAGNIRWRTVSVWTVAGGNVLAEFARAAAGAECDTLIDDRLELRLRNAVIDHPPRLVEAHLLHTHTAVVDQIAGELHTPPLVAWRRWQMVHQRALLGEEAEHVTVPAHVHKPLHQGEHVVLRLAHADDDMGTELLRPEDVPGVLENFPVLLPGVRRGDALTAGSVEDFRRGRVECDGEDVRTKVLEPSDVFPRHGGRIGKNGHRHHGWIDPICPSLEHRDGILVRPRMRDHGDAHAVERRVRPL